MHTFGVRGLVCLTTCLVLAGCGGDKSKPNSPRPVRVQEIGSMDDGSALRYSASLIPQTQINLSFKAGGYIREIAQVKGADGRPRPVQQGDPVRGGTVLARVEEAEYVDRVKRAEAGVARSRAVLQKAEADFGRAQNLFSTQSITAPDYDRARKDFETAEAGLAESEAQLDEARLALGNCELKPPQDGVLLKRNIEVGTLVRDGTVGFVLADLTSLKAVFGVPDVVLSDVRSGERLDLTTASYPRETFSGVVTAVSPSADPSSRVFEVEVTLPNPEGKLRDGMVCALEIESASLPERMTVVPLSAVVRDRQNPDGYALFVVSETDQDTHAELRPVEVGSIFGDQIAITKGAGPGDRVIVSGAKLLSDGEPVRIIP